MSTTITHGENEEAGSKPSKRLLSRRACAGELILPKICVPQSSLAPHDHPIRDLIELLVLNPTLAKLLLDSLKAAKINAIEQGFNMKIFPPEFWPQTLQEYLVFLSIYVRWVPNESEASAHNEQMLNMLCHFYWLVSQDVRAKTPRNPQADAQFAEWIKEFNQKFGSFMDTPESITPESLQSFIDQPDYHIEDSMIAGPGGVRRSNNPSGWVTFNQLFARELNPGLRPVAGFGDDRIITSPADSTFKAMFPISRDNKVCMKLTHNYTVDQLMDGSPHAAAFEGGTFVHCFLGPSDYHRFHVPVSGTVLESRTISGLAYLDVNIKDGQYDAPDSALDGYEFNQERGLIVMASSLGKVAVLPIGMAQVSSVYMLAQPGVELKKGDEFGYFTMGGSDIILLFEKDSDVLVTMVENIHYNVGRQVARSLRSGVAS